MADELLLYRSTRRRSPHGEGFQPATPEERSHGEGMGGRADHRVVPPRRSRDRVGDDGLDPVFPGCRHRRRRRGVASRLSWPVAMARSGLRPAGGKGERVSPFLPVILLAALVCALAAPARAQEPKADGAVAGGVYRRALGHDPATLDPARISDIYSRSVSQQIFDGLVQFDQTLAIAPALAQFWRASRDGLTWTFMLRKGVQFHHGREVTADDVVYSFTRILDPRTRSGAADLFTSIKGAREFREGRAPSVAGLNALDRHTVQVVLADASVPFVSVLAVGHAKIVPKELVEREGDGFGLNPVGTGPFRFLRW